MNIYSKYILNMEGNLLLKKTLLTEVQFNSIIQIPTKKLIHKTSCMFTEPVME